MKNFNKIYKTVLLFLCLVAIQITSVAQINIGVAGYRQEFNSLGAKTTYTNGTTIPGWFVQVGTSTVTPKPLEITGPLNNPLVVVGSNPQVNTLVNFGINGSEDRSLGSRVGDKTPIYYGVWIKNTTGQKIAGLGFRFDVKTVYNGKNENGLTVSYKKVNGFTSSSDPGFTTEASWTSSPGLFTNKVLADGGSSVPISATNIRAAAYTVDIPVVLEPNEEIFIRFLDNHAQGNSGADDDLAIDNFEIKASDINVTTFYSKPNAALNLVSSWTSLATNDGILCRDFSIANQTFFLQTGTYNAASFPVIGSGSRFIVPAGNDVKFTGTGNFGDLEMELEAYSTVTIDGSNAPTFGVMHETSTVIYSSNAPLNLATYQNLTIDGSGFPAGLTKVLLNPATIARTLTLKNSGRLEIEGNNLTLQGNVVYDNTSFIQTSGTGKVRKQLVVGAAPYSIPVGTTSNTPVILALKAGDSDWFSVSVKNGLFTSYAGEVGTVLVDQQAVNRTWFISEDMVAGVSDAENDLEITLMWTEAAHTKDPASGVSSFDPTAAVNFGHYETRNSTVNGITTTTYAWDHGSPFAKAQGPAAGFYSLTRSGFKTFSPFAVYGSTIAMNPGTLPVEFTSVTAARAGERVNLAWTTASEKNNDFFQVEISDNGKDYRAIGSTVKGAGTSALKQTYQTTVTAKSNNTLYFRVKQVDFDGKSEYSKVVAVKAEGVATRQPSLLTYPNPTQGQVTVVSSLTGFGTLSLYQSSGKKVWQQQVLVEAGQPLDVNLSNQLPGIYFLQVQTATGKATVRLVKQ